MAVPACVALSIMGNRINSPVESERIPSDESGGVTEAEVVRMVIDVVIF